MSTLDDLLSQRRRAPLGDADERRVQIGVQASREHQLALLAGEVFEREGLPQPGDAELVRKIVRQVEGEWSGTFQRLEPRRPPRWSRWAAVPTLVAGVAAASWGGVRALQSLGEPALPVAAGEVATAVAQPQPAVAQPQPAVAPIEVAPIEGSAPVQEPALSAQHTELGAVPAPPAPASPSPPPRAQPAPSSALRGARAAGVARRLAASSPAPVLLRPAAPPHTASGAAASVQPVLTGPGLRAPARGGPDETARSLFLRANQLRRNDWLAAAGLYELLTQRFAASTEAGVAEMALGKHALDEGHPGQALRWFRAYQQRPGGELTAEALWGEARALESLGEATAARVVWRRLVSDYPASAYAAVARQQLGS